MRTASACRSTAAFAVLLLSCSGAATPPSTTPDGADQPAADGPAIVLPDGDEVRASDCSDLYDDERAACEEAFAAIDQCIAEFSGADRTLCVGAAEQEYVDRLGIVDVVEMPDGSKVRAQDCPDHRDILLRQTCRQMFHDIARCRKNADGARSTPCEQSAVADYAEELRAFDSGQ